MLLWFAAIGAIGALGIVQILNEPRVLLSVNPIHAFTFVTNKLHGIVVLGSVVLCITGGDMVGEKSGIAR